MSKNSFRPSFTFSCVIGLASDTWYSGNPRGSCCSKEVAVYPATLAGDESVGSGLLDSRVHEQQLNIVRKIATFGKSDSAEFVSLGLVIASNMVIEGKGMTCEAPSRHAFDRFCPPHFHPNEMGIELTLAV